MTSSPLYPQSNGFIDNSPDSEESSRKSRSLRERPLHVSSTFDTYVPFHTYRQQPTIAYPTAESQRLPHTVTNQWMASSSQALDSHREQLQNQQNIQRKQYDSRLTLELRKPISR